MPFDPIEHSSTIDSILKNISNNTKQDSKESAETIDGAIETTYSSAMNPVKLNHMDVLELDSALDSSIANSISQTPILTELEPSCSTPVDMGFLVTSTNYMPPDPLKNVFENSVNSLT